MRLTLLAAAAAVALAFSPAQAALVTGTFGGTLDGGTDLTGIFGTAGADLSGVAITGTVQYDTAQLIQTMSGTTTIGTATLAPSALQFTVTIAGFSYSFTSATAASVVVDTAASQVTLDAENTAATPSRPVVSESATLDAFDPLTPFTIPNGLEQAFSTNPLFSSGTFSISDIDALGLLVAANGIFIVDNYALTTVSAVPEPASLALLTAGVTCLALARRQRTSRDLQRR